MSYSEFSIKKGIMQGTNKHSALTKEGRTLMSLRSIAEALYEDAMDMDWMDYQDTREDALMGIAKTLGTIQDTDLFWVLERVAEGRAWA